MSSKKKSSKKASKKKKRDKDKNHKHDHERVSKRHRSRARSRSRSQSRSRNRTRRSSASPIRVDKKKLLEIARANVAAQTALGTLGTLAESATSSTSKSLGDFVEYYRKLSNETGDEVAAHLERHPFNVRPLEIVDKVGKGDEVAERAGGAGSEQLSLQYPVSSGTQHRSDHLPSESDLSEGLAVDVNGVVAQRLDALKRVASDPNDLQAYDEIRRADKSMNKWICAKQVPGLFVGSTDAKLLSAHELKGCYQAWVRKDVLTKAAPIADSIGRKLLEKMGWRQGQGLGKNKEGTVDPLALDIKTDRKGLVSQEDISVKALALDSSGEPKHPVSALIELCNARKWLAPEFGEVAEDGPPHQRMFLMSCSVNGVEYVAGEMSFSKKMAKAKAALACLQALGVVHKNLA